MTSWAITLSQHLTLRVECISGVHCIFALTYEKKLLYSPMKKKLLYSPMTSVTWSVFVRGTSGTPSNAIYILITFGRMLSEIDAWKKCNYLNRNINTVGPQYRTLENQTQWNTKHFEVLFSNGPTTRWTPFFGFPWSGLLTTKLLASLDYFTGDFRLKFRWLLNTGSFCDWTTFNHSNTRPVRYSDHYCTSC